MHKTAQGPLFVIPGKGGGVYLRGSIRAIEGSILQRAPYASL